MMRSELVSRPVARLLASVLVLACAAAALAGLPPELDKALRESKFVYIQSERKSGSLGTPSEIWFLFENGSVYVGTRPSSFRVRRIKAGRRKAHIAVGKVDGPAFDATGEIVKDPTIEQHLMEAYAKKYEDGWRRFETSFRDGFKTGDRVLVRYKPN